MEGAVSAAQQGLSRTPGHHRQTIPRGPDSGRVEEELRPVVLEERPRVGAANVPLLLQLCRRHPQRDIRRRAHACEPDGALAGIPPVTAGDRLAMGSEEHTAALQSPLYL